MARIVLDPDEVFEHIHSCESTTVLLSGSATLHMGGRSLPFNVGEPVSVPANTSHVIRNTGDSEAVVGCGKHISNEPLLV
jgi:mannose-6-phosphate isomerase-like protein (cupin superfamily)